MAVYTADPAVESSDAQRSTPAASSTDVVHVVSVDHADHVPKDVRPALAVVKPGEMFRLLQNGHISLCKARVNV